MKNTLFASTALLLMTGASFAQAASSITSIADAKRGTMVTLEGVVDRITDDDEFRLRDATGSIEIDVGSLRFPVDAGENVTVQGFVDDDFGPRELYARTITRENGTVITIKNSDY